MPATTLAVPATYTAEITAAKVFLDRIFPAPRQFDIRLWEGTVLPGSGRPTFTLVVNDRGSLRRMFQPPVELSLGEGYLRREFDVEGDLPAVFEISHTAREVLSSPSQVLGVIAAYRALPQTEGNTGKVSLHPPARLTGQVRSLDRDRAAIQYHYDVGNEFYELFLDRQMVYSCAYFATGREDLEAAQEAKLDLICRKLRLRPRERLLDIGCGWGGLLLFAAKRYGVSGLGVTLSEAQHRLATERVAREGLSDRIRIELRDYRSLRAESFDKIVSVGMFEHVGRTGMAEYFRTAFEILNPGGLFLNHAIASRPGTYRGATARALSRLLDRHLVGNLAFRTRYVFPDGELIPVSEANLEAETAGFEVRDVENLREHYALTLRHWFERLRANRRRAVEISGEAMFRLWEMYLAGSAYHFETARININQTLFAKAPVGSRIQAPRTREEIYSRAAGR